MAASKPAVPDSSSGAPVMFCETKEYMLNKAQFESCFSSSPPAELTGWFLWNGFSTIQQAWWSCENAVWLLWISEHLKDGEPMSELDYMRLALKLYDSTLMHDGASFEQLLPSDDYRSILHIVRSVATESLKKSVLDRATDIFLRDAWKYKGHSGIDWVVVSTGYLVVAERLLTVMALLASLEGGVASYAKDHDVSGEVYVHAVRRQHAKVVRETLAGRLE